ncbi:unnamed protein product [Oppiella nova]|uniref:Legumain n=1 Tax=Oppiella nova TaxID=334625 RepID=A0A7R9LXZ3_9ACAR|nr:unnamed protein product [Oppiella nova]CAG2167374.1 unnamed protein product [Oppiella nova]
MLVTFTPIVNTTLTYDNTFVCNTSTTSAIAIDTIVSSGSYRTPVTCNGLTIANSNITFSGVQRTDTTVTNITVGQYLGVNTYTNDKLREPHAGKTWVVLAASSSGWENYGMEADVYHAYQVVRQHGIPDENIVVMHYDDIAHHKSNPTPGVVINRVGGKDVYKTPYEVPKHYIGKDVNPENFLGILKGDEKLEKAGKKVVKSGPNDRIFVYLDDHGGDEVVFFPTTTLHAKDLNNVLIDMHKENKFSQLVFYLAACEAATLPGELGWKAESDHTNLNTYLGDKKVPVNSNHVPYKPSGMAPIRDSELYRLQHKIKITNDIDEKLQYVQQLKGLLSARQLLDKQIEEYVNELPGIDANIALNGKLELNNRDCYKKLVDTFNEKCYVFSRNTYAINKLAVFFAVIWLDDSEHNDLTKELISTQYEYIKIHNNFTMHQQIHSHHAQQYGDLSIATKQPVSNYMGDKKVPVNSNHVPYKPSGMAPIRDSELYRLQHKIKITNDIDEKLQYVQQLKGLLNARQLLDKQIEEYVNELPGIDSNIALNGKLELNNRDCYKKLVDTFNDNCYVFSRVSVI